MKIILAIEIAYMRAFRFGDLSYFSYDQVIKGKIYTTRKSNKSVGLSFDQLYRNNISNRLALEGINVADKVVTTAIQAQVKNNFSRKKGAYWKANILPFILRLVK